MQNCPGGALHRRHSYAEVIRKLCRSWRPMHPGGFGGCTRGLGESRGGAGRSQRVIWVVEGDLCGCEGFGRQLLHNFRITSA